MVLNLPFYAAHLEAHGGHVDDYVVPDLADHSGFDFASRTRPECCMEHLTTGLPNTAIIGCTVIDQVRLVL